MTTTRQRVRTAHKQTKQPDKLSQVIEHSSIGVAVPCAVRDRYLIESCDPGRPSYERCRSWCLAGLISCWEGLRRDGPLMAGWMLNYICFIHTRALFAHFQCKYCHPRLAGAFSRGWQAMYRIHPSAWFEIGEPHRSVCPCPQWAGYSLV